MVFVKLAAEGLKHGHERRHWGGILSEFILTACVFVACHAGSTEGNWFNRETGVWMYYSRSLSDCIVSQGLNAETLRSTQMD